MTDQYQDLTPAQFRLSNSTFTNNSFAAGGNLIQFNHNSKYEYIVTNVTFEQNIQAQINLNPGDTQNSMILQKIQIYNCRFYENSPLIDAFFRVQSNSRLIVDNSTFDKTYSMSRGGVFLADYQNVTVLDSIDQLSMFQNCMFQSNGAYSLQELFGYIPDSLQQKILQTRGIDVIDKLDPNQYSMSVSKASLLIQDCEIIYARNYINAYIGNITINNVTFKDSQIQQIHSSFQFLFQASLSSSLTITNVSFVLMNVQLLNMAYSNVTMKNMTISNVTYSHPLDRLMRIDASRIQFRLSNISNIRQPGTYIFEIKRTTYVEIYDNNIINFNKNFLFLQLATARIFRCNFEIQDSFFQNISTNNPFLVNRAVYSDSSKLSVKNTFFRQQRARQPGGGAISYNKFKPLIYKNNTFEQNYAPYGPDIAGYPYGVKVVNYDNYSLASGQLYTGRIQVQVIDPEYNVINTDNTTNVKIEAFDSTYKVSGETQIKLSMGNGVFDDLEFQAVPGSKNITYKIFATTINTNNVRCSLCSGNTFSFYLSENTCNECPLHAECPGGKEIIVSAGYWRSNFYSSNVMQCLLDEACIGGSLSEDYSIVSSNDALSYPLCKYGYGGNLCHNCLNVDKVLFTRIGKHECGLCPSKEGNILKITGIFLALMFALTLLLWVNLRSVRESETSVIIRILLNYVQILTSAAAFNLEWPVYLQQFFNIFGSVGEISESFISFDCFLQDTGFTQKGSSTFYFKTLVIAILPILMCLIFSVIFYIWKVMKNQSLLNYKRQVIVSTIVVIYTLHPTITRLSTSLFFCMEIDKDEEWLQQDLEIRCWSGQHLLWALSIGIPSLIVWVVGLPAFGFLYFYKRQDKLREPVFFSRYRAVYQGLKQQYFYWEFVNILRKVFLVSVNVFLNLYSGIFKALLSLAVLICFQRVQQRLQPYNNPVINILESREYNTSIVTFFGALFFVSREISDVIQLFAFIGILAANIWFILLWGYCFTNTLNFKFTQVIAKILQRFVISQEMKLSESLYQSTRKENLNSNGQSEVSSKHRKEPQNGKPSEIFMTSKYTDLGISNINLDSSKHYNSQKRQSTKITRKMNAINQTKSSKVKQSEDNCNNQSIIKSEKNKHDNSLIKNKTALGNKQRKALNNTNLIFGSVIESIQSESNQRPTATGIYTQIDAKMKLDTQLPLNNKSKGLMNLDQSIPSQFDKDTHSDKLNHQDDTVFSFQQNNSKKIGSMIKNHGKYQKSSQKDQNNKNSVKLPSGEQLFKHKLDLVKQMFSNIPNRFASSKKNKTNGSSNQKAKGSENSFNFYPENISQVNNQTQFNLMNGKNYIQNIQSNHNQKYMPQIVFNNSNYNLQYIDSSQKNEQQEDQQMNILDYSDKLMQKQITKRKNRQNDKKIQGSNKKISSKKLSSQKVKEAETLDKNQAFKNIYDDYPDIQN
eukprot:403344713